MTQTPRQAARVLGLLEKPTLKSVKKARRELAIRYHPDRCEDRETANRHMARINAAADTLISQLTAEDLHTHQDPATTEKEEHSANSADRAEPIFEQDTGYTSFEDAEVAQDKEQWVEPERDLQTEILPKVDREFWRSDRLLAQRAAEAYERVLRQMGCDSRPSSSEAKSAKLETVF